MKCLYCGAALNSESICSECGKKIDLPGQEVEIEYKEFKISEFLEIRRKHEGARSEAGIEGARKDLKDIRNTLGTSNGTSRELRNNKKAGIWKENDHSPRNVGNNLFLVIIMITVIVAVMAGAFYLPHFFSQR